MGYAQKVCEDCGRAFTERGSVAATIAWAEHIRTKDCPAQHHPDCYKFNPPIPGEALCNC